MDIKCPDCKSTWLDFSNCDTCKRLHILDANALRVRGLLKGVQSSGVGSATIHKIGHIGGLILNWQANLFSQYAMEDPKEFEEFAGQLQKWIDKGDAYLLKLANPHV